MKFENEGRKFAKILRSLFRTICSKSERSEQYLKQNIFLNCYWRFLPGCGTIKQPIGTSNWTAQVFWTNIGLKSST